VRSTLFAAWRALGAAIHPRKRAARRDFEAAIEEASTRVREGGPRLRRALERALERGAEAHGERSPELAAPLYALAAHALSEGDLDGARVHGERLDQLQALHPTVDEPTQVQTKALLAAVELRAREDSTAAKVALEAWARAAEAAGDHAAAGDAWNQLALTIARVGERDVAATLFEKAKRHRIAHAGPDAKVTLETIFNAATYRSSTEPLDEAEASLRHVVKALEREERPTPLLASALHNLAVLREERGDLDEAKLLFLRALQNFERTAGPTAAALRPTLVRMALLHHREGSVLLAIEAYDRAYDIATRELGADHPIAVAIGAWKAELTEGLGPSAVDRCRALS
jgi:tetratricopeptide (TPR) repeat protein